MSVSPTRMLRSKHSVSAVDTLMNANEPKASVTAIRRPVLSTSEPPSPMTTRPSAEMTRAVELGDAGADEDGGALRGGPRRWARGCWPPQVY